MKKFSEWKPGNQIVTILFGMCVFVGGLVAIHEAIWPSPPLPRVTAYTPIDDPKVHDSWERYDDAVRRKKAREGWERWNSMSENDRSLMLEEIVKNQRKVFGK